MNKRAVTIFAGLILGCGILLPGGISLTRGAAVGELKVTIKEWDVPTKGAHPHDPAIAPDGSLWFTEQLQNKLGRLDPASGAFKEYVLKIEDSGPHGLVADANGNIWFTGNGKGYIGKLNPKSGDVTEYKMPDAKAEDPHTAVFDAHGILWFTVQVGSMVGRLDPHTGKIDLKAVQGQRFPTASPSTARASRSSANSAPTKWPKSIHRSWPLRNSSCRKARGLDAWPSMRKTKFISPTTKAGIWAASILPPAR